MRVHIDTCKYVCVCVHSHVLSLRERERERERRTRKFPVHSSGLSINAPIFTANIIETACSLNLLCCPFAVGGGGGIAGQDPAAYAQIVGS